MKNLITKAFYGLALSLVIMACGEEEPPPPHPIVGAWELDAAILKNLPVGYQNYENFTLTSEDLFGDGDPATSERMEYDFSNDQTYKRTIYLTGPNDVSTGTWLIEEENLTLTPDDDAFDIEFEIVGEIEESEVTLSTPEEFRLFSDEFSNEFDTLTAYTFEGPDDDGNGISDRWEEMNELYSAPVQVDLWFILER